MEFFICNSEDLSDPDGVPTQGCFNMYPLTRSAGDDVNSPIDPNYPGRYYVDPECREEETDQEKPEGAAGGYVMHMNYDLPAGLTCKRCILQMVYCECSFVVCDASIPCILKISSTVNVCSPWVVMAGHSNLSYFIHGA